MIGLSASLVNLLRRLSSSAISATRFRSGFRLIRIQSDQSMLIQRGLVLTPQPKFKIFPGIRLLDDFSDENADSDTDGIGEDIAVLELASIDRLLR